MNVNVRKVDSDAERQAVFGLRREVFVVEQKVSIEDEFDEFEDISRHFIALNEQGETVGTARWRYTEKGIKLERFAVAKNSRKKGVGSALVATVLDDIATVRRGEKLYLHAQLDAVPLYAKFGFEKEGEQFEECDIWHYLMVKNS